MAYNGIAAIAILSRSNIPCILHVHHVRIPPRIHTSIPNSSFLCSSSSGLLLFLEHADDQRLQFHICNPFIYGPAGYIAVTTEGMPRRACSLAAVLSLDRSDPLHVATYISCPVHNRVGVCGFISYSAITGWRPYKETTRRDIRNIQIAVDSGISCGRMAYWLADSFETVVPYDPVTQTLLPCISCIFVRYYLPGLVKLCVVMGNHLCYVVANKNYVQIHLLAEDNRSWAPFAVLDVQFAEDAMDWRGCLGKPAVIQCEETPIVLRSESSRLQIMLLIDDSLYSWESERVNLDGEPAMILKFVSRGVFDVADLNFSMALAIVYCDLGT